MIGWHFCKTVNGKPVMRDGTPAKHRGETETYDGEVKLCERGLHASERAVDALGYSPGNYCRRVELDAMPDGDKAVGNNRKILGEVDATKIILKWCAEEAINAVEQYLPQDEDSIAAALLAWLSAEFPGDVPKGELAAASAAAWAAARAAARAAASAAARAAARAAAWAAWAAASAASAAARAASAAASAASDAAWAASDAMKARIHRWIVRRTKSMKEIKEG